MKPKPKLQPVYLLHMDAKLRGLDNDLHQKLLAFARFTSGKPDLEILPPELDAICDAAVLIKSGVIECSFTDSLPCSGEGYVLKLNA